MAPKQERDLLAQQYYHLGMILAATNRHKEARAALEHARLNARDPVLKERIRRPLGELT